ADASRDPQRWLAQMDSAGVTVWNTVPALLEMLVEGMGAAAPGASLGRLRLVLLSGDWIGVTLPERVRGLAPGAAVVSLGGATEGSIWSIAYPIGEVAAEWASIPYGWPLANQGFVGLDEGMEARPEGGAGGRFVGGPGGPR